MGSSDVPDINHILSPADAEQKEGCVRDPRIVSPEKRRSPRPYSDLDPISRPASATAPSSLVPRVARCNFVVLIVTNMFGNQLKGLMYILVKRKILRIEIRKLMILNNNDNNK